MRKGMDPEAVQTMATDIADAGREAKRLVEEIDERLNAFEWTGEDRDQYVANFRTGVVDGLLAQIVQQTEALEQSALDNVSEQTQASA